MTEIRLRIAKANCRTAVEQEGSFAPNCKIRLDFGPKMRKADLFLYLTKKAKNSLKMPLKWMLSDPLITDSPRGFM
jgi:hypothetical protein